MKPLGNYTVPLDEGAAAPPPDKIAAIDTETTLFDPPEYGWGGKTRISPWRPPRLVLGSVAAEGRGFALHRQELLEHVRLLLRNDYHLVFHNCRFDVGVLIAADRSLKRPLARAIEQGRIHDTFILEQLVRLARGGATERDQLLAGLTLEDLARRYAGMRLVKDARRVTYAQFEKTKQIPQAYLEYAVDDAVATYRVYLAQRKLARRHKTPPDCDYPAYVDAEADFGLLGEKIQVMGAVALDWLERFPLRVDLDAARERTKAVEREARQLEQLLIDGRLARRGPKTGKFSLSLKTVRAMLQEWSKPRGIDMEYSDSGLISTARDFWSDHIPKFEALAPDERADHTTYLLSAWARYSRLRKILTTYLYPYTSSPVHYPKYYTIGARTTRMSSSRPNAMNVPKRRDGIRGLFVPDDGYVFVEGDWAAAELSSLAQVYHLKYGGSSLGRAISAGQDPHSATAARVFGDEFEASDEARRAEFRQASKVVNFGLPGGMGPAKLSLFARSYGVTLDVSEARELRNMALSADEELARYLSDTSRSDVLLRRAARNLQTTPAGLYAQLEVDPTWTCADVLCLRRLRAWARGDRTYKVSTPRGFRRDTDLFRQPTRTVTGFVRGRALYTEAHNTPFQGPVADAAKRALFLLWAQHPGSTRCWWRPVVVVHDSVMIEVRAGREEDGKRLLDGAMTKAVQWILRDVPCGVDVEVKHTWAKE